MTPKRLASLHRAAFVQGRPWSAAEFEALLETPFVNLIHLENGFALTRTLAGDSELLTLAVDPAQHRQGIGRVLCKMWLDSIAGLADRAFLEVADDNHPAVALYGSLGFCTTGRRKAYYARENAAAVDAILMQLNLTRGQPPESHHETPESG